MTNNLIERVLSNRRDVKKTIFDLHADHHAAQQVDLTSFQAKKTGLKYLGFGRYGKVAMANQGIGGQPAQKKDKSALVGGQIMVTHIVKNGLLVPTGIAPPEARFYPTEEDTTQRSYQLKQAAMIKKKIEALSGPEKSKWNSGIKALNSYLLNHEELNGVLRADMLKKSHPTLINKVNSLTALFDFDFVKLGKNISVYLSTSGIVKKGESFETSTFTSTVLCPKTACGMLGGKMAEPDIMEIQYDDEQKTTVPSLLQIDLKRGQRVLDVISLLGGPDYVADDMQEEFILPRGATLKIIDGPIYLKHAMVWRAEFEEQDNFETPVA